LFNAIITNTSDFLSYAKKIALEFFIEWFTGSALASLHQAIICTKIFLGHHLYATKQPPIHLVIPIQDPGARAVYSSA